MRSRVTYWVGYAACALPVALAPFAALLAYGYNVSAAAYYSVAMAVLALGGPYMFVDLRRRRRAAIARARRLHAEREERLARRDATA